MALPARLRTLQQQKANNNNNNNNKSPNRLKHRNKFKPGSSNGDGRFKSVNKIQISLILIIVALGGITLYFNREYFFPEKVVKMSDIIRLHVRVAQQIIEHELRLKAFLLEDPTMDVVKNGLRPIQERISSLRVQTSQYEKMSQISGGPTNFIETSIKELETIMQKQLIKLANDALASISEQAKSIGLLSKSSTNLVKENHQTTDPTVIRSMIIDDLVITPMDDEKDEIEKLADGNFTTIEDAMDKLMHLAQLYDDLTKTAEKTAQKLGLGTLLDLATTTELTDEEYDAILPSLEELLKFRELISEEKKKYMKHYKVFWVLKSRVLKNTLGVMERLKNYEQEKRAPFLELQAMILKDVANLKIRIQNLQYTYAKKSIDF